MNKDADEEEFGARETICIGGVLLLPMSSRDGREGLTAAMGSATMTCPCPRGGLGHDDASGAESVYHDAD
jgi:hypothetical protein